MTSSISPLAGKTLDPSLLLDVPRLLAAYVTGRPDPANPAQRVAFGTSGHRGSAFDDSFNEAHVLAISQAICQHRHANGIDGPLFAGTDTHALSRPALATALQVFTANGVDIFVDANDAPTPTPVISHAILTYNRGRTSGFADGIILSPSHNPPEDGGYKYNLPNGGPAENEVTRAIEDAANTLLARSPADVRRFSDRQARTSAHCHRHDYIGPYVAGLAHVVDMEAIRGSGVRIGIDPLGGAAVPYWAPIIDRYRIAATVVSDAVDPTFRFMTADWDGRIRMDCSSPYAMKRLIGMTGSFDVAFANDTDADRHGIVAGPGGLMNPNHYLAAAIAYLLANRPGWRDDLAIGKTAVSSGIIDRVVAKLGRRLFEVPVGFKWFVEGLLDGSLGFVGEESAGASFLRRDGSVWTTDKDGLILGLLAAEITAQTGKDPAACYDGLRCELGTPYYARIDAPATAAQRAALKAPSPGNMAIDELAGEPVRDTLTAAPGNGAALGGFKVIADNGWFAARPSGTEDVYKIYAESFQSEDHLEQIQHQAQNLVSKLFSSQTMATS